MSNGKPLWCKGDGVWVTAGERWGHAGEVIADQKPDDPNVMCTVRGGTDKRPGDVTGPWPANELQPYRWYAVRDTDRIAGIIAHLHPEKSRLTMRTYRLAHHLQMHGIQLDDPDPHTDSTWRRIALKLAAGKELTPDERTRLDAVADGGQS